MSKVTAAVKATLIGTHEDENELAMSQQSKTNFIQHARKDESSGELFMTEDEFIDAIAPKDQDYVSSHVATEDTFSSSRASSELVVRANEAACAAQNSPRPIWNPLSGCRSEENGTNHFE